MSLKPDEKEALPGAAAGTKSAAAVPADTKSAAAVPADTKSAAVAVDTKSAEAAAAVRRTPVSAVIHGQLMGALRTANNVVVVPFVIDDCIEPPQLARLSLSIHGRLVDAGRIKPLAFAIYIFFQERSHNPHIFVHHQPGPLPGPLAALVAEPLRMNRAAFAVMADSEKEDVRVLVVSLLFRKHKGGVDLIAQGVTVMKGAKGASKAGLRQYLPCDIRM